MPDLTDLTGPWPDPAHDKIREAIVDLLLLVQTTSNFADTFLGAIPPLQNLATALAMANPRKVTDGVTTAGSTTVTSASAQFAASDQGRSIAGGSIPAGATIATVVDAQTVTVSAAPTAGATAVTLTIG